MHLEIQVALNFVISHLYNKLPRRRVNIFGEELEKALKQKFQNHWYPEQPMKGSAYRCLKTGQPLDAVLERAARESNINIQDILENLPIDMAVWIDPGEVSCRIGEKGQVKILWSEMNDTQEELNADREVTKTFNPEAQIFQPVEVPRKSASPFGASRAVRSPTDGSPFGLGSGGPVTVNGSSGPIVVPVVPPTQGSLLGNNVSPFFPATRAPNSNTQFMTTAAFAQTKFGSTKLKTSSKRTHRMSPTEFSNYIKQKQQQQQQQQQQVQQQAHQNFMSAMTSRPRSLSPQEYNPFGGAGFGGMERYNPFDAIWSNPSPPATGAGNLASPTTITSSSAATIGTGQQLDSNKQLLEGLSLGLNAPYRGQYQHLLVAN